MEDSKDLRHLYLIAARGIGLYKIGTSNDPARRLSTLQLGAPYYLDLLATSPTLDRANARAGESHLHHRLAPFRFDGPGREWYGLDGEQVEEIVQFITTFSLGAELALATEKIVQKLIERYGVGATLTRQQIITDLGLRGDEMQQTYAAYYRTTDATLQAALQDLPTFTIQAVKAVVPGIRRNRAHRALRSRILSDPSSFFRWAADRCDMTVRELRRLTGLSPRISRELNGLYRESHKGGH